jgi:hypothetical protein
MNPVAIFFSLYMYVPIGTLFQANQYHLCEQLPFLTTSYNIPGSCFAVMTSEPANYLVSVL